MQQNKKTEINLSRNIFVYEYNVTMANIFLGSLKGH